MQIVVVSSPGTGGAPHWSHELASEFAQLAVARGAMVRWLAALHKDQPVPCDAPGLQVIAHRDRMPLPPHKVASSQLDVPIESTLTDCLRAHPLSVVVHIGLGGHGSPNVLWLADRMGSRTHACVRGVELACHRGDLLDRDQNVCTDWSRAERCRWCCSSSRRGGPRTNDLRNRVDLFIAGLQTCTNIHVPSASDLPFVTGLGIAAKLVSVGATAEDLVAQVFSAAP